MSQVFGTADLVQNLRNEGVLSGVKRESVHVEFINGHLVIFSERINPAAAAKEAATTEQQLADGILHLTLPFDTEKVTRYHIKIR